MMMSAHRRIFYHLAALVLGFLASASPATADNGRLLEICDDCKVEKFATCPSGSFLEGPSFDKNGNLWLVGVSGGTVLKVTPNGQCTVAKSGISSPGSTRFDRTGKLILTSRNALLSYDTETGEITTIRQNYGNQAFRGLNDLVVDKAGGIYFTEPNGSNAARPNGRVFYLPPSRTGELTLIGDYFAFPNGLVLSPDEAWLYIADFAFNRVIATPLASPGVVNVAGPIYEFVKMAGGRGPDGMLVDSKGNVYVAQYMARQVAIIDPTGFQIGVIKLPPEAGLATTNLAFHNGYLYITDASKNEVWRVKTKIPGVY